MAVLLSASGLFVVALILHIAWWRVRVPRQQSAVLIGLFLATATCGVAAISVGGFFPGELPLPRLLLAILLFGSFGVVYLILFSALESDSPTLTMLGLIAARGSCGIRRDELMWAMKRHSYAQVRIDQMVADGMAIETPSGVRLAAQGLWLSSLVLFYRRLLVRKHVGG